MKNVIVFILISLLFSSNVSQGAFEKRSEIKVLTLNTWMIPVLRKMAKARAEAIGREISKYDIALLQEVFTPGVRKTITTYARENDIDNRYQTPPKLRLNGGMLSLTSYSITKSDYVKFKNCGGVQCLSAKGVLYIQVKLPNGKLVDLFNTHFQAYEKDRHVRVGHFKTLREFIAKQNDGTIPVIVSGDFNVIGGLDEYDYMMTVMSDFKDVWKTMRPNEDGFTWNPYQNYWAEVDYSESMVLQRLDYIFIRDGQDDKWQIQDVSLAFDEEKIWYGVYFAGNYTYVSDHFGVETTLHLVHK